MMKIVVVRPQTMKIAMTRKKKRIQMIVMKMEIQSEDQW
jgi:hypothetical protein